MRLQRPDFASSYGLSNSEAGMIAWAETRKQLMESRNYWIATADAKGLPHTSPVWGVWMDDRLYFGTDEGSRKATNIAGNPKVVIHLESGDDVVIFHCDVATTAETATVDLVFPQYRDKYSLPGDFTFAPVFCATPTYGFAWKEADFPNTATKYVP